MFGSSNLHPCTETESEKCQQNLAKLQRICQICTGRVGQIHNSSLFQGLALALSVPVFVVVTKIDMCPGNVLQETLKLLVRILRSPGCRKYPVMVKSKDDVVLSATKFVSERLCPIFQVSNVTGENLDLLTMFMNLLSNRTPNTDDEPSEFQGGRPRIL